MDRHSASGAMAGRLRGIERDDAKTKGGVLDSTGSNSPVIAAGSAKSFGMARPFSPRHSTGPDCFPTASRIRASDSPRGLNSSALPEDPVDQARAYTPMTMTPPGDAAAEGRRKRNQAVVCSLRS